MFVSHVIRNPGYVMWVTEIRIYIFFIFVKVNFETFLSAVAEQINSEQTSVKTLNTQYLI